MKIRIVTPFPSLAFLTKFCKSFKFYNIFSTVGVVTGYEDCRVNWIEVKTHDPSKLQPWGARVIVSWRPRELVDQIEENGSKSVFFTQNPIYLLLQYDLSDSSKSRNTCIMSEEIEINRAIV